MPNSTTTLKVTFVSESAAYENTFGWYNSVTGEGGILFADVETDGRHPPLTNGATTTFTVNTADLPNIQYFLIPNGANENPPDDLTGAIKVIQLSDGTWAVADVDSHGNVIYVHGHPDLLEGTGANALFTETSKNAGGVDYASSVAGTHQTSATLAGDTADGPTGTIAWEDQVAIRHGHSFGQPGDADYNDAVFNITLLNAPPETNNVAATGNEDTAIAVTLSGADSDGTVTSFRITSLPANGTLYSDAALTHAIAVNGTVTASGNAATVYFVPNANFNGGNAFQYASIDNGGLQDSTPATASITVNPVNDAPAGTDHTVTLLEDGSYTFATSDFGFSDPNDTPANTLLAVEVTTLPGAGTLTDNGVAVTAGQFVSAADIAAGLLKFTPAANGNGAPYASFTFQVRDNGGTANGGVDTDPTPNTINVNVTSVNDAPAGADKTVHAGAVYVFSTTDFGFSDPNDNPANHFAAVEITTLPSSGTLTLNGNAVHAGDFISVADISSGRLQFTAAGGASASFTFQVRDDGGTANGGVDLDQSPNTLTLVVNTPPVANDDSVAATEAGGLNNATPGHDPSGNVVLGTGDAGNVQDTDAQDPSSALIVVAAGTGAEGAADNGTVGTAFNGLHGSLLLASNGTYSYAVNQTDAAVQALHMSADTITDVFHYTIQDAGGLTDSATLTITIHGANDLPQAVDDAGSMTEDDGPTSFNAIANDTLDPDSTAANTISVGSVTVTGPAGETFANTDAQATIVANQIRITLNNANFQQLALGEHATVTVPYTLTGDAGDTSSANLVVTVNGVNDVPVAVDDSGTMTEDQSGTAFTVLTNDTLDPDHGAPNNVTAGAVTNVSAPSGENIDAGDVIVSVNASNQVVVTLGADFQHLKQGETATFDVGYTLHGDQPGDNANATLHVTVTGVNDAPVAQDFTFNGTNSGIGNTSLVLDNGGGASPVDPPGPQKTISGSLLTGATDVDGPNPLVVQAVTNATTSQGGHVTITADGDFTYLPAAGFTGSDTFTYTISDGNTPTAGTDTGTVTINVAAPRVWYVNADAATDGDGTSDNPFNTLTHFQNSGVGNNVDSAGDIIVLETAGNHYTGGLTLENNEQLISQSNGLTVNGTTLFTASGANAVVDGGVVLASGNTIQGVNFGTTGASGFSLSGTSVGTAHINDVTAGTINNASGGGISIGGSSNALTMHFTSVTTSGATNGIAIASASGTVTVDGGAISGASGDGVSLSGVSAGVSIGATITSSATGHSVQVLNSGSTAAGGNQITFSGLITDSGLGINLDNNDQNTNGATINFSGGLDIDSTTNTGFKAINGGTVNVTGSNNSITTTIATALDIEHTAIGSNNVTFQSISSGSGSNSSATGIILDTTGSSGGLHVTGTGTTAGSGGTIQHKIGADGSTSQGNGIYLNNTSNVQLANMQLNDFQNYGIVGTNVTNFTLAGTTVNGTNGTSVSGIGEGDVYFTGLSGSASVTNSTFTGAAYDAFHVFNDGAQTLNRLTITGSTFATNSAALNASNDAIGLQATGGTFNVTVQNSTINSARSDMFQLNLRGVVSSDLVLTGNTMHNTNGNIVSGGGGITVGGDGPSNNITLTYDISNNSISGAAGADIAVSKGTGVGASFTGTISGNTIGTQGVAGSGSTGGEGIFVKLDGAGTSTTTITNNHISGVDAARGAIDLLNQNGGGGKMVATITGNTIDTLDQANSFAGMYLQTGSGSTDNNISNLTVNGNAIDIGPNTAGNLLAGIVLEQEGHGKVGILGSPPYNGGSGTYDFTAVENYVASQNTITAPNGQAVFAFGNPAQPAGFGYFGTAQLMAAAGGVESASNTLGETHLTQAELDAVVQAAIANWAAAGASSDQIAALQGTIYTVADLPANTLGAQAPGLVLISANAAGYGWFIDPSPFDNAEFAHAANASGTDLFTDSTQAAAGHMDLLTAVTHEMGHVLGLPDDAATNVNDLMFDSLVAGERRLPTAADVVATPALAQTVVSGQTVAGTSGADSFVMDPSTIPAQQGQTQPIAHVVGYSAAQGDRFDFSALTQTSLPSELAAALTSGDFRVAEDASGTFATLQVHDGAGASDWLSVAQLDGVHAGDPVNVALDAAHVAHLHAAALV